jgi:hypothetical protein
MFDIHDISRINLTFFLFIDNVTLNHSHLKPTNKREVGDVEKEHTKKDLRKQQLQHLLSQKCSSDIRKH